MGGQGDRGDGSSAAERLPDGMKESGKAIEEGAAGKEIQRGEGHDNPPTVENFFPSYHPIPASPNLAFALKAFGDRC